MRLLVTGSTGFIGSHLTRFLTSRGRHEVIGGYRTTCLDEDDYGPNLQVLPFDVCNADIVSQEVDADVIFHVATANDIVSKNFESGIELSLNGTKNVLDFAVANGITKIVFFSTLQVYGTDLSGFIDEDTPIHVVNEYALNHQMGEELCKLYSRVNGLDIVLMRPSNVYGLPSSPTVSRNNLVPTCMVLQSLETNNIVLKSSGRQTRNFISLEELSMLCNSLLDKFPSGTTVINAGSNLSLSITDVAKIVAKLHPHGASGVDVNVDSDLPIERNEFVYRSKFDTFRLSESDACREFEQTVSKLFDFYCQ